MNENPARRAPDDERSHGVFRGQAVGQRVRRLELEGARFLAAVAAREGAELRVLDRGRHAVAYAKGAEPIADVLVAAGASDTMLVLEESSVLAAIRADANLGNAIQPWPLLYVGRPEEPFTSKGGVLASRVPFHESPRSLTVIGPFVAFSFAVPELPSMQA